MQVYQKKTSIILCLILIFIYNMTICTEAFSKEVAAEKEINLTSSWSQKPAYQGYDFQSLKGNPCENQNDTNGDSFLYGCTAVAVGQLINYYFQNGYSDGWLDLMLQNVHVYPRFTLAGLMPIKKDCIHGGLQTEDSYPDNLGVEYDATGKLEKFLWNIALGLDATFKQNSSTGVKSYMIEPHHWAISDQAKLATLLIDRFRFNPKLSLSGPFDKIDLKRKYIVASLDRGDPVLMAMDGRKINGIMPAGHMVLIYGYRINQDNSINFKINFGWGKNSTKDWYPGNGAFDDALGKYNWNNFYIYKETIPVGSLKNCSNIISNKPKPLATAIVFDHSGSMADERKIDYAREATFAFTPHMKEEDLLSVSIFSNDAKTPVGLELKKRADILPSLRSILPTIAPNGQTNIGAGLESGLEQLCTVSGENVKKGALLLSDGMNNVGSYDVVVQDYKKWQIPIYTVKFGNQASEDNLRKIAENTGGVYMDSNQETVTGIYSRMYHHINGDSTITASHDPMSPTGKLAYHVDVSPGANSLHVNTSWQGSRLKTIFTSPSGSTFSGNHLPGPTDRFEEGSISQYTQILNPESGLWKLDISWDEPPAETERVNLLVSEHTDVYTSILGFSPEYSAGEQVTINAHAAELDGGNNKIPLKNARVKAKVQIPGHEVIRMIQAQSGNLRVYNDVIQDNTREVELFDDGAHNDYKAGDGIFGGFFTETQRNGSYIVSAYIEGNRKNGGHVSRRSTGTFQVGSLLNAEVTTSKIMQYARQLEERMKAKVANPLGGMQSPASPHPTSSGTPSGSKKKRSRSLMDSLSN